VHIPQYTTFRSVAVAAISDPLSIMEGFESSELYSITNDFYHGAYARVLQEGVETFSPANQVTARCLQARSLIALGRHDEVERSQEPALAAVYALAQDSKGADVSADMDALLKDHGGDGNVVLLAALYLSRHLQHREALDVLIKAGDAVGVEGVALMVQLHLLLYRPDLAHSLVDGAKRVNGDAVPVVLAEAWTHLHRGGSEYEDAFYIYEEAAQIPVSATSRMLTGQGVTELHLGRPEEAVVAFSQAAKLGGEEGVQVGDALANALVAHIQLGASTDKIQEARAEVQRRTPNHVLLQDVQEKSALFDALAAR